MLFRVIALAFLACSCASADERPNIVLVMMDDVGVEGFGCYGGLDIETPAIDALAAEGVRFSNCHSQPLCTPSRVKIMTSKSNARNYVRFGILDPNETTFADRLRDAGYRTLVAGKWQLYGSAADQPRGAGAHPADVGFDEYCLWQLGDVGARYWKPVIDHNNVRRPRDADEYGADVFCAVIKDFIDRCGDDRFLVYYPMVLPHFPMVPTPDSADRESTDKAANFRDMVAYADTTIGGIVEHLESRGLMDDTLVIVTSDNGTARGYTLNTTNGPVQGGKGLTVDRGTHVPLVVAGGGVASRVCEDLVDFADIGATMVQAAGLAVDGVVEDGRSFLPQLHGQAGTPRELITCYYDARPGNKGFPVRRFARDARWKLYDDGRFFDVVSDPEEQTPIGTPEGTDASSAFARLGRALRSMSTLGERRITGGHILDEWQRPISVRGLDIDEGGHTRVTIERPFKVEGPLDVSVAVSDALIVGATSLAMGDEQTLDLDVAHDAVIPDDAPSIRVTFRNADREWAMSVPVRVVTHRGSLAFVSTQLPAGTVGEAYRETFAFRGGGVVHVGVPIGELPSGLRLDEFTGEITGVPRHAGVYRIPIVLTGASTQSAEIMLDVKD